MHGPNPRAAKQAPRCGSGGYEAGGRQGAEQLGRPMVGFDEAKQWGRGRRDGRVRVENQHKHRMGGVGVDVPRGGWRLVAGVVVMLLALVVVGRLQGGNLPGSDAEASRAASTTVADATPVASGLVVAGRVALPGPAAAVAVGEGAIWVLLEEGHELFNGSH
jgi:hypothetical protein